MFNTPSSAASATTATATTTTNTPANCDNQTALHPGGVEYVPHDTLSSTSEFNTFADLSRSTQNLRRNYTRRHTLTMIVLQL
jgi:hypothetical protein